MAKNGTKRGSRLALDKYLFEIWLKFITRLRPFSFGSDTECQKCTWRYDMFELIGARKSSREIFACLFCGEGNNPRVKVSSYTDTRNQKIDYIYFTLLSASEILEAFVSAFPDKASAVAANSVRWLLNGNDDLYYSSILRFGSVEEAVRQSGLRSNYRDNMCTYSDDLIAQVCGELPDVVIAKCIWRRVSYISWVRRCHKISRFSLKSAMEKFRRAEGERAIKIFFARV